VKSKFFDLYNSKTNRFLKITKEKFKKLLTFSKSNQVPKTEPHFVKILYVIVAWNLDRNECVGK